ncbi:MAG TPA: hypothetical protein VKF36_15765 [Syntrophorhabdales bacterium]|nr:hypothetical protein [Syntrophorhabdales bacterium]
MKKWQIMLLALFLVGLVAAVFGALPDSDPARTQNSASRHRQFGTCGVDLKVKGDVGNLSDGAEPNGTPGFTGAAYPYENSGAGPFVEGSRYADYNGIFSGQLDVLSLEIVGTDDCSGKQRSRAKKPGKSGDDIVIRVAEFSSLGLRN